MTLDDAITILAAVANRDNRYHKMLEIEAEKLGLEALRHYRKAKQLGDIPTLFLLPGETIGRVK